MEQAGGVVTGGQELTDNHAKNSEAEAAVSPACAPKAATAAVPPSLPRHRRSRRSVSACFPPPTLHFPHPLLSPPSPFKSFDVLTLPALPVRGSVHLLTGTRRHASMDRRRTGMAPSSNAVTRHRLPSVPARQRLQITELFTREEGVECRLLTAGFVICVSDPAGREEVWRNHRGMLGSPAAARSQAQLVAQPPRVAGE